MATNLVISLPSDLAGALDELARQKGVTPEALVIDALRDRPDEPSPANDPRDDWERLILKAGSSCGVSPPNEALSSEGLYE
jgi:predicted transcriptional regulator